VSPASTKGMRANYFFSKGNQAYSGVT